MSLTHTSMCSGAGRSEGARVERLVALLVAIVATLLNMSHVATAVTAPARPAATHSNDGHRHSAVTVDPASERGLPSTGDHCTAFDAVDRWSYGPSARPTIAWTFAVTTYDHPMLPVQVATVRTRTEDQEPVANEPIVVVDRGQVAANTAAKVCSFAGATTVLMADGTRKPIEAVKVGDRVIATDPETGEQGAKRVEHVFVHEDTVIDLVVDGEVITTTEDHPFWSNTDQRFERADQLAEGEQVLGADGRVIIVSGLRLGTARETLAYNLSVEGIHTYHVGEPEILVHNQCGLDLDLLSASGAAPAKNGMTRSGRAYQKHMGRGELPVVPGRDLNSSGQYLLDDILTAPGTQEVVIRSGNFAGGVRYIGPDGVGATFDSAGAFQYFGVYP